jgi:hypothetical protein
MTLSIFNFLLKKVAHVAVLLMVCMAQIASGTVYIVNSTADSGAGSLRDAITQVNLSTYDTINFAIPTSDSGYNPVTKTWTIQPATELPFIISPVTIDGYTQPGSSVNTLVQGDNAVLTIVLNGANVVSDGYITGNGLHFLAGSDASIVRGLVINQWALNGILIDGANGTIDGISIVGNFIGTDASGTVPVSTRTGVGISGIVNPITNTQVGTAAVNDRNIFGGSFGYMIFDSYSVRGACISSTLNNGTLIANNYIGTDKSGIVALGLTETGITFFGENTDAISSSIIGGSTPAQLNLISGCTLYGVNFTSNAPATFISGPGCVQCYIQGNNIGTDITGTFAIGNGNAGITLNSNATSNSIISNLISGNGVGIRLGQLALSGSNNNLVQGNHIGTDSTGTHAIPNIRYGIIINDYQNFIDGTSVAQANIISGNGEGGILIYGTSGNVVVENYIGTDISGTKPLANDGNGIQLGIYGTSFCAALGNIIGGY